jgi:hypothetical protein
MIKSFLNFIFRNNDKESDADEFEAKESDAKESDSKESEAKESDAKESEPNETDIEIKNSNTYCLNCKNTTHTTNNCEQIKKQLGKIKKFCDCNKTDEKIIQIELEKYNSIILIKYIKGENIIHKLKYCDLPHYDNSSKSNHIKNIITYYKNIEKILVYKKEFNYTRTKHSDNHSSNYKYSHSHLNNISNPANPINILCLR